MSKQIDDGGAAFPHQDWDACIKSQRLDTGMSLRDYFAAAALQGLLATYDISKIHPVLRDKYKVEHIPIIADESYKLADAMLAARKENNQP